jgi:hypothetical protein
MAEVRSIIPLYAAKHHKALFPTTKLALAGKSYRALAKQAFGRVLGKVLMEVTIDLYIIGTLTGYVNIIGTVLTPFAMEIFKWDVERQLDMFKLVAAAGSHSCIIM